MARRCSLNQMYLRSMMDLTIESFRYLIERMEDINMYRQDTQEIIPFVDKNNMDYETFQDDLGQWVTGRIFNGLHFTGTGHCQRCAENDCAKQIYMYWRLLERIPEFLAKPVYIPTSTCLTVWEDFVEFAVTSSGFRHELLDYETRKLNCSELFKFTD